MSPIPPNKEIEKTSLSSNENLNNGENNEIYNEAIEANGQYVPLSQAVNYTYRSVRNENHTDDTSSSSDDDDDDEETLEKNAEIDPDTEFEMLASSRADPSFTVTKKNDAELEKILHLTEIDVFQRKNQLEPEDILIDENTSKKITGIMSNFKLPDSSIPEWAKKLPEDKWKKNLLDALNAKKTDLFSS